MSIRSTLLFFLLPIVLQAQIQSLISDKDIVWAAKVEAVVGFDAHNGSLPLQMLEAVPVKAIQDSPEAAALQPFTKELLAMIEQGVFPAFADQALQQPLTQREARSRLSISDTIVVFDPETYEERIHIIKNELLGATSFFVTQQLWLYHDKTKQLETIALAIAPAVEHKEQPGTYKPLVWFQLPPPRKSLYKLKSPQVQFATYVRYNVSEEHIEVIKGKEKHLKEIFFEQFKAGKLIGYDQKRQPINPSAVEDIFIQQDTIITFDPETYEEKVQVVRLEFGHLDIMDFRMQQAWFFAPSRKGLQCTALGLAPAIPIIDEYGFQLALRPLFFWRRE